jgi:CRISPR-associated endonuclease Cas2
MFVILTYDVAHHHSKFKNLCSEYLIHEQGSVFDGDISKSLLKELVFRIETLLKDGDALLIYEFDQKKYSRIEFWGQHKESENITA